MVAILVKTYLIVALLIWGFLMFSDNDKFKLPLADQLIVALGAVGFAVFWPVVCIVYVVMKIWEDE